MSDSNPTTALPSGAERLAAMRLALINRSKEIATQMSLFDIFLVELCSKVEKWNQEHGGKVSIQWSHRELAQVPAIADVLSKIKKMQIQGDANAILQLLQLAMGDSRQPPVPSPENALAYLHGVAEPQPFPLNRVGLTNGSYLIAQRDMLDSGIPFYRGDALQVAWTGDRVMCQQYDWALDQLADEIKAGYWVMSLSPPEAPAPA